jgi:hypothetical protein
LTLDCFDRLHENLGRAEPKQEAILRQILHHSRLHRNLDWMSRVRRNDPPAKLNAFGLAGDNSKYRRRRPRLKRMLAPPGISLSYPKRVKPRILTGLGHGDGFVRGLHAELQDSNVEWDSHDFSGSILVFRSQETLIQSALAQIRIGIDWKGHGFSHAVRAC